MNNLASSLLRLPGKISNRVYKYVFYGSETVVIYHKASSVFWNACIINAEQLDFALDTETVVGPSSCACITSFAVNEVVALKLSDPSRITGRVSKTSR
jgi:hypothetical protein